MRALKFTVKAQQLKKDISCDFSGLVKGSKGYLQAEFSFSEEYVGCGKIAVFRNQGEEYPVRLENNNCIIPEESAYLENIPGMRGWSTRRLQNSDKLCGGEAG